MSDRPPIPADTDGRYDVRKGIPSGLTHFPGLRLTVTCRALGIECAAAIIGDAKRAKFGPKMDGVVIRIEDQARLEEGIQKRDAARPSDAQKAVRKENQQASDTAAFLAEIREQFPLMPEDEAVTCAAKATEIGSGRVGRSSSVTDAARRAVIAHVRHCHTPYDRLLEDKVPRDDARAQILQQVQSKINQWSPHTRVVVKPGRPSRRNKRPTQSRAAV